MPRTAANAPGMGAFIAAATAAAAAAASFSVVVAAVAAHENGSDALRRRPYSVQMRQVAGLP